MKILAQQIVELLAQSPGMTDREITSALRSGSAPQQPINIAARDLANKGVLIRKTREDGLIGNYPGSQTLSTSRLAYTRANVAGDNQLSEDQAKELLRSWLEKDGWSAEIAWGRIRGIDIDATRGSDRWIESPPIS